MQTSPPRMRPGKTPMDMVERRPFPNKRGGPMKGGFIPMGRRAQHTTPPGTKPSVHHSQLLISSGIRSLDEFIGGGFPLSATIGIKECVSTSHYITPVLRYFLGEGATYGHTLLVKSKEILNEDDLRSFLPLNYTKERLEKGILQSKTEQDIQKEIKHQQNELKIAFQYKQYVADEMKKKQARGPSSRGVGHSRQSGTAATQEYDLSRPMQSNLLTGDNASPLNVLNSSTYNELYHEIAAIFNKGRSKNEKTIFRLVLHQIDSPLLYSDASDPKALAIFLFKLKSLMRRTMGVCVLSFSQTSNQAASNMLDSLDSIFEMQSIPSHIVSLTQDYVCLFYIRKLFRMNALSYNFSPVSLNYGCRLKKRRLTFEKLHLGPEETRAVGDPNRKRHEDLSKEILKAAGLPCASGMDSSLPTDGDDDLDF